MVIVISHLTIKTIVAFVLVNLAHGRDGLNFTLMGTDLTRLATFTSSSDPVK